MSEVVMEKELVFESRWGFHPCSHETFLKLKKLHKMYWQAVYRFAEWNRWAAKAPQNRIKFRWIRNENRQKIGKEILGPKEEPKCLDLFMSKDRWGCRWVDDHGIINAYQQARMPKPKEEVKHLSISEDEINNLYSELTDNA